MRPVSASITIDAPRERLFDLLCDLSLRPSYTDHFLEEYRLSRVDPSGIGAGARFRVAGSGTWLDTTIEEAERPHLIRERGSGGLANRMPVFAVWEISEGPSPQGSEVQLTFWSEPAVLFDRLRNPLGRTGRLRRQWKRALRRLKEVAESGDAPVTVGVAGGDRIPVAL
jgi:hypothetical protein